MTRLKEVLTEIARLSCEEAAHHQARIVSYQRLIDDLKPVTVRGRVWSVQGQAMSYRNEQEQLGKKAQQCLQAAEEIAAEFEEGDPIKLLKSAERVLDSMKRRAAAQVL